MKKTLFYLSALAAAIGGSTCGARAVVWNEIGDAGNLPINAQVVSGPQVTSVSQIKGTLNSGTDVDMYRIGIDNPISEFSANTEGSGFDTQLFLFNGGGVGACSNDDAATRKFSSAFSAINCGLIQSGQYYLAISQYNVDPLSAGGRIFPDPPFNPNGSLGIFQQTGPGGRQPVSAWTIDSTSGTGGNYVINLQDVSLIFAGTGGGDTGGGDTGGGDTGGGDTGGLDKEIPIDCSLDHPEFCVCPRDRNVIDCPEPGSLALLFGALTGMGLLRWRRYTS